MKESKDKKLMHLKILLPFKVFSEETDIKKIIIETPEGLYGYLPNRLDCVAVVVPGIFYYESESKGEVYIATDEGIFMKNGKNIFLSVRNTIGGVPLGELHKKAMDEFLTLNEQEKKFRSTVAQLESNFIRKFTEFEKR